jgi:hypothetical protein
VALKGRVLHVLLLKREFVGLDGALECVETICQLLDVAREESQFRALLKGKGFAYPLLGPLFMGTLLNWQREPTRLQLVHCSLPSSPVASHLIFLRRHSSQARETFDLLRGAMDPSGVP